ncbi:MAG: hypothetical protein ACI39Q_05360 [Wujia sp.]
MTKEQIREFTLRTTQENHSGLILVLCDIERVYISDAIAAYDEDVDCYMKNMELAKRAHNELMSCFDPADPRGRSVLNVLRFIYGKLVASTVRRSPQDIDRCVVMLDTLRVGFEHLHEIDTDGPVMQNTHRVYAGLTYGKGVLNENALGVDYSSRGFKI